MGLKKASGGGSADCCRMIRRSGQRTTPSRWVVASLLANNPMYSHVSHRKNSGNKEEDVRETWDLPK